MFLLSDIKAAQLMNVRKIRFIFKGLGIFFILFASAAYSAGPVANAQSLQNWSDPINLSNAGSSTNPIMVVDTEGVIHVIWVDEFEGYKYVQSANGVDWTTPVAIPFPFLPEHGPPRFEVTADGIIHIFWVDDENNLYYIQAPQTYLKSPASWRSRVRLADFVVGYDVAVSKAGNLHVSYIKNEGSESAPAGVYYRGSFRGGLSWTIAQNIFASPYFRSLTAENAHVRTAVTDSAEMENIYVVWDSRPQKQIFLAKSLDGGQTWAEAEQLRGPEESTGYQTPHNAEISVFGKTVLLLWQVGESSNQCMQFSQFNLNAGDDWEEPTKLLGENLGCPEKTEIFALDQNLPLLLLNMQGGLSLMAWNGNQWSDPQMQNGLLEFFNPATFDSILLGCQQFFFNEGKIYLVGCDQGSSGDIWFSSRSLGPVENWYPSLSGWNKTGLITNTEQMISSLASIAHSDSVHLFWVQSARSQVDRYAPSIQYSRWNDEKWLPPRAIMSNLAGTPLQIAVANDLEGRLLLVWVDGKDGYLYFSWAVSEEASHSSEWIQPVIVPSSSQLNRSPDMLVDASGRIIIAHAISLNEGRGIYIIQSTDLGSSWSAPLRVFDAVSAGWERVDNPKISLSGDGRIHILFNRYSMRDDDQSTGLYYLQSVDGGATWSEPELVREGLVTWSDIYSDDEQAVHRIWQEKNGKEVSYIDQYSFDGGLTWEGPVKILGASEETTQVSLAIDQAGSLHLAQLTYGNETSLQDWKWDGSRWSLQDSSELNLNSNGTRYSVSSGVTLDGNLVVSIIFEISDLTGIKTDQIWGAYRILNLEESPQDPSLPIIPTPNSLLTTSETTITTPPSIDDVSTSPLADIIDESSASNRKNLVGLFLVATILILTVVIIRPKRKK